MINKDKKLKFYLGFRMAGQSSLKNMNPETTLVFTNLSLGHFC